MIMQLHKIFRTQAAERVREMERVKKIYDLLNYLYALKTMFCRIL